MSKLSAVAAGQPTQGLGAAPQPAPRLAPARQHASPLEAQRAEAEAAGAMELDDLGNPLVPVIGHPPGINPRSAHSAAAATMTAAWLSLTATELEVRKYFRSISVPSGLEALAKMRKQCDLAAAELQQRMDDGNKERCTGCGKTLEETRKSQWLMMGSDMDPETGVPVPYRFCGPLCIRERNKERMLPKEERNKLRFDGQDMGEIR